MWEPDPAWLADPPEYSEPHHFAYWRREADVAISGITAETPGLRATPTDVVEDDDGITLTREWVEDAALNGLYVAHAMGRFAGADFGRHRWLAVGQLRDRMRRVERRGGWPTLARTTVSDVADRLWSRRVLGQGATVLLFTDGLERQVGPDLTFEMDRLKRSCRRLVWLNPLLRFTAFEPRAAGIRTMLPHVHDFRPIHNLDAMEDLCAVLAGERQEFARLRRKS